MDPCVAIPENDCQGINIWAFFSSAAAGPHPRNHDTFLFSVTFFDGERLLNERKKPRRFRWTIVPIPRPKTLTLGRRKDAAEA
jgi:hypothetical protein